MESSDRQWRRRRPCFVDLLLMASTASALSLNNLQIITSTDVSLGCILVYNSQISGCTTSDFKSGQTCSSSCINGLQEIQSTLQTFCASSDVSTSSLLGQAQKGNLVNVLCPGKHSSTTTTATSTLTTATSTPATTTRSTISLSTASPTTSAVQPSVFTLTTQTSTVTPSTHSAASISTLSVASSTLETTSATSTASEQSVPTPETIVTAASTTTQTTQSSTTTSASSSTTAPSDSETGGRGSDTGGRGGGSPFDTVDRNGSQKLAAMWWLEAFMATFVSGLLLLR